MGLVNTPTWLLSVMGKSGLFRRWAIKLAEVITWFHRGTEGGGFTYWPDGPLAPPKRLTSPMWNRGVVTQNTAMYHRGESNGPLDQRANPKRPHLRLGVRRRPVGSGPLAAAGPPTR